MTRQRLDPALIFMWALFVVVTIGLATSCTLLLTMAYLAVLR